MIRCGTLTYVSGESRHGLLSLEKSDLDRRSGASPFQRIVKEASRLFRERGFDDVSVGQVMNAAGLTHGAFYAHFDSKEELQAAAVVAHGIKVSLERMRLSNRKKSKASFADLYLSRWHRDNPGDGCTMAALAQEVARSTPELKVAFEQGLEKIVSAKRGDRKEAIFRVAAMIGGVVLARAVQNPRLSDEILESVRQKLG
jgi:TetR/AcrR family transcriptional regulator, transcriptional repressor for nem operon